MAQSINKQIGAVPAIEAELHLCEVSGQMLSADLVPRSDNAALQEREGRFDCVSRDASAILVSGVFLGSVVDGFVSVLSNGGFIGGQFVSDDYVYVGANVLLDVLRQRSLTSIFGVEETNIAAALTDSDNDLFLSILAPMLFEVALLSANIRFVHLDRAVQHRALYLFHGRTDAVTEIPCRLVTALVLSPDGALELQCTHSLFRFTQKQGRHKPDRQRQVGVIEDRTGQNGELIDAGLAKEKLFRSRQFDSIGLAAGAAYTFGPAEPLEQFAALFIGREHLGNV